MDRYFPTILPLKLCIHFIELRDGKRSEGRGRCVRSIRCAISVLIPQDECVSYRMQVHTNQKEGSVMSSPAVMVGYFCSVVRVPKASNLSVTRDRKPEFPGGFAIRCI